MKTYKNKIWSVHAGNVYLLDAFTRELASKGYGSKQSLSSEVNLDKQLVLCISAYQNDWQVHGSVHNPKFILPQQWDEALKYILAEDDNKFKSGDFVICIDSSKHILRVEGFDKEKNSYDIFVETDNLKKQKYSKSGLERDYRLATDEEMKEYLMKRYEEKTGLKKGVLYSFGRGIMVEVKDFALTKNIQLWNHPQMNVIQGNSDLSFCNDAGSWYTADSNYTVVSTMIAGYIPEVKDGILHVGCQTFTKNSLEVIVEMMKDESITFYSSVASKEVTISKKQIEGLILLF